MTALQQNPEFRRSNPLPQAMSPVETALYTCDLLESLRKIAQRQGQTLLAHLLELAFVEAKSLSRSPKVCD
jgi:hypothetical protein